VNGLVGGFSARPALTVANAFADSNTPDLKDLQVEDADRDPRTKDHGPRTRFVNPRRDSGEPAIFENDPNSEAEVLGETHGWTCIRGRFAHGSNDVWARVVVRGPSLVA
jgi:hypothetical protein